MEADIVCEAPQGAHPGAEDRPPVQKKPLLRQSPAEKKGIGRHQEKGGSGAWKAEGDEGRDGDYKGYRQDRRDNHLLVAERMEKLEHRLGCAVLKTSFKEGE